MNNRTKLILLLFVIILLFIFAYLYYLYSTTTTTTQGETRGEKIYNAMEPWEKQLYDDAFDKINQHTHRVCPKDTNDPNDMNQPIIGFDPKDAEWIDDGKGKGEKKQRHPGRGCVIGRTLTELTSPMDGKDMWCCTVDPDFLTTVGPTEKETLKKILDNVGVEVIKDIGIEMGKKVGDHLILIYGDEVTAAAMEKTRDKAEKKGMKQITKPTVKLSKSQKESKALLMKSTTNVPTQKGLITVMKKSGGDVTEEIAKRTAIAASTLLTEKMSKKLAMAATRMAMKLSMGPLGAALVLFDNISMALDFFDPFGYADFVGQDILVGTRDQTIQLTQNAYADWGLPWPPFAAAIGGDQGNDDTELIPVMERETRGHDREFRKECEKKRMAATDYETLMSFTNTELMDMAQIAVNKKGVTNYYALDNVARIALLTGQSASVLVVEIYDIEYRKETPEFEGVIATATHEDDDTRNHEAVYDWLEFADLLGEYDNAVQIMYPTYDDNYNIVESPIYDANLYHRLKCEWFNKYEKPLHGFGSVFVEGLGCSLDREACLSEEKRYQADPEKGKSVYWSDIYWGLEPGNPGDVRNPNVVPIKLSAKACLQSQFKEARDRCEGKTMEKGYPGCKGEECEKWRLLADVGLAINKKKGNWNDSLQLCDYEGKYCQRMGMKPKRINFGKYDGVFTTDQKVLNCIFFPGQEIAEMIFGQTVTREFTKALSLFTMTPKEVWKQAVDGENMLLSVAYHGSGLSTIVAAVNFAQNPVKATKDAFNNLEKLPARTGLATINAVSQGLILAGNGMNGLMDMGMAFLTMIPHLQKIADAFDDHAPIIGALLRGGPEIVLDFGYALHNLTRDLSEGEKGALLRFSKTIGYAAGDIFKDTAYFAGDIFSNPGKTIGSVANLGVDLTEAAAVGFVDTMKYIYKGHDKWIW